MSSVGAPPPMLSGRTAPATRAVSGTPSRPGVRAWLTWEGGGLALVIGLLVREGFSFWTGHPYDFEVWIRTGYVAAHGVNPYLRPWPPVPGVSFGYLLQPLPSAAYLPFWPDIFGATYRVWEQIGGGNRFLLYFLLKQGPIVGDLAVALLLYRCVLRATGDRRRAVAAMTFWSLFPYDIVIGSIWGQLDSVTTAVILLVLLASEAQAAERSIAWGVGVFLKWITAIFLPLELFWNRGWKRLWPFVGGLLAVAFTLAAFLAAGWGLGGLFDTGLSQSGGGGGGMNLAQLFGLPGLADTVAAHPWLGELLGHLWVPGILVAGWVGARWARPGRPGQYLRALLLVTTVFLLLRWGLYEQYLLYPFALLVVDVYTCHPGRRAFFYYLVVVASAFLVVNDVFGVWFVTPVDPGAFAWVQAVDNSPTWGTVRSDLLDVLAVLATLALVQLVWVLVRDQTDPVPWPRRLWPGKGVERPGASDVAPPAPEGA